MFPFPTARAGLEAVLAGQDLDGKDSWITKAAEHDGPVPSVVDVGLEFFQPCKQQAAPMDTD